MTKNKYVENLHEFLFDINHEIDILNIRDAIKLHGVDKFLKQIEETERRCQEVWKGGK